LSWLVLSASEVTLLMDLYMIDTEAVKIVMKTVIRAIAVTSSAIVVPASRPADSVRRARAARTEPTERRITGSSR
jgi:hypothetical protein